MSIATGAILIGAVLVIGVIGWVALRPRESDRYVSRRPRDLDGRPTRRR